VHQAVRRKDEQARVVTVGEKHGRVQVLTAGCDHTTCGTSFVIQLFRDMWTEGLIPDSAQADSGANFQAVFQTGKLAMQGSGNFAIATLKASNPEIDFGIAYLPGIKPENASSFVGGDLIAIPKGSKNEAIAREFITWVLTDEAQLEGLAAKNTLVARTDLAENDYYKTEPRYFTTAKAVGIGQTPWVFHFNDMVNSESSPWLEMLQTAIFDGDVDGAIETAREKMKAIASE
jgi:multiple sugar transport system substrate-binding protein